MKLSGFLTIKYLFFIFFWTAAQALCSQAQNYGLGGSTSGRANSVLAEVNHPYAALYNPALIAAQSQSLFGFSTGIQQTRFRGADEIKLKNQSLATWALGFSYPIKVSTSPDRQMGFGLALSGPYQKLRTFSAYAPEDAFVMRYGGSDSQFKATLGAGIEILPRSLYLGGGLSLYMSTAGAAEENIVGSNPTGRVALDVGLNSAAIVGLYAQNEKTQGAFTFHQQLDPTFTQSIDGKISVAGSDVIHQPMLAKSSLYYEPQSVQLEGQHRFGNLKTSMGLSYEFWSRYKAPILITEAKDNLGGTRVTQVAQVPMRNTWNPRISFELPADDSFTLSSGYQYRPSPVVDLSGTGNYLDSSAHVLGLSISYNIKPRSILPWPTQLGLYGQYHWLNSRKITKTVRTSETPPDFTFQGNAAVYGLCLQTAL